MHYIGHTASTYSLGPDQRGGTDIRGHSMAPDLHERGPPVGPNHRDFHGPPDGPPHGRGMPPHDRGKKLCLII